MTKSKSILFIPSWYPTETNKFIGNNYRLQINLFEDIYNTHVLCGTVNHISIFEIYKLFLNKVRYFNLYAPPQGIGFYFYQIKLPSFFQSIPFIAKFLGKLNYSIQGKAYLKEVKNLRNIGFKPDLIHAFSSFRAGIVSLYLSKSLNIPYVVSEHQVFLMDKYTAFDQYNIKNSLIHANKVLPVSEHQHRQILMNYIPCNTEVIGNFIDDHLFKPTSNYRKDKTFTVLSVTYDSFIKDNNTLFKALQLLKDTNQLKFKVILVGGNFSGKNVEAEENPLFNKIKQYGLENETTLLSFLSKKDMPAYYNQCDVFVSTSVAETFGMAQCEAVMCGIPVIATANGGIDDIIDNSNGIKVPLKSYEKIADTLMRIATKQISFNPQKMRKSVVNKYGREAFKNRLSLIYNDVIDLYHSSIN